MRYGTQEDAALFCLGQQQHAAQIGELICRVCGSLIAGAHLGIYQIHRLLGKGRSGNAYLASHLRSRQQVVLKLFPPDPMGASLWEAARREVRVVTSLHHSSILPVFSCTTWYPETSSMGSKPFNALTASPPGEYLLTLTQYVPATLSRFIAHYEKSDTPRTPYEQETPLITRLVHLIKQAGSALSVAHARGIAHGALVPGNILLDGHDRLWIADFGLARLHPTPHPYLAPELYSANHTYVHTGDATAFWGAVTPASDQYTFAVICQQLLTRLLPAHEYEPLLPVLQCATSQRPTQRFTNIDTFVHELLTQATRGRAITMSGPWSNTTRDTPAPPTRPRGSNPQLTPINPSRYEGANTHHSGPSYTPKPTDDWEKRGDKLFAMHDYDGAVRAYQQALQLDASKATPWLALGDAYLALENYAEALRAYEQAMFINPNDPLAWSNRGTALDALGRRKEAIDCYERADQLR